MTANAGRVYGASLSGRQVSAGLAYRCKLRFFSAEQLQAKVGNKKTKSAKATAEKAGREYGVNAGLAFGV